MTLKQLREIKEKLSRDAARIAEIKDNYLRGSLRAEDYLRIRAEEESRYLKAVETLLKQRRRG